MFFTPSLSSYGPYPTKQFKRAIHKYDFFEEYIFHKRWNFLLKIKLLRKNKLK